MDNSDVAVKEITSVSVLPTVEKSSTTFDYANPGPPLKISETSQISHKTLIDVANKQASIQQVSLRVTPTGDTYVENQRNEFDYNPARKWRGFWIVAGLFAAAIAFTILATIWKHYQ